MVVIACRTPGTAAAVPAKMHTAATASTGRSQTIPARARGRPSAAPSRARLARPAGSGIRRTRTITQSAASAARYRAYRP
jgi:hypothetical protein